MKMCSSSSSVLTVSLCLLLCLPPCLSSEDSKEIKVKFGEEATLPCQSLGDAEIAWIKWTKPGLSEDRYVFFYRDGKVENDHQIQSYRGRVELKDKEMKDGILSVILKNVTTKDAGTYQCVVKVEEKGEKQTEIILTVQTGSQDVPLVKIYKGEESVQLPCNYPTFDLSNASVVWSRSDLHPSTIHQRQWDGDKLTDQNQNYSGRTSMRTDAQETGKLNLTLEKPTITDSGDYTCIIRWTGREEWRTVTLLVKEPPQIWLIRLGGLCGILVVLVAVAGYIWTYFKKKKDRPSVWIKVLLLVVAVALCSFCLHEVTKKTVGM